MIKGPFIAQVICLVAKVKGIDCAFVGGVEGGTEGGEERGYRDAYGAGVGDVDCTVVESEGDTVGLMDGGMKKPVGDCEKGTQRTDLDR